jgi:hypothetical protein
MRISIINKTLQYFITFIFLCVPSLINAQDSIFDIADKLFEQKDYKNAALEYERIVYNSTSKQDQNQALFKKATSYKENNNYLKASQTLDRIQTFSLTPEQQETYYYEKMLCYYLNEEFEKASSTIEDMYLNIDSSKVTNTLLIQVFIYNELSRYQDAKIKAKQWVKTFEKGNKENKKIIDERLIDDIYANIPKQKSEKIGKILSYFPGLGHLYAGYPIEGIACFVMNASIIAFGVYEAYNAYYLTAYLGGAGILSGTYFGGYARANYLIRKHNYKVTKAFNDKVRGILLN